MMVSKEDETEEMAVDVIGLKNGNLLIDSIITSFLHFISLFFCFFFMYLLCLQVTLVLA